MSKPNGPLVLDPTAANNANIVTLLPFNESSGNVVGALAGSDFAITGVEDTDFEWLTANNGNYVAGKNPGAVIIEGVAKTADDIRTTGSLIIRFKTTALNTTKVIWSTGSSLPTGNGQARVTVKSSGSTFEVNLRVGGASVPLAFTGTFTTNTWYTVVVTWTTTNVKGYIIDDTATKYSVDSGTISWPGITVLNTKKETLIGTVNEISVEFFEHLNIVVNEDDYLTNPYQDVISAPEPGINRVEVKVGSGAYQPATGTDNWACGVELAAGANTITAKATDNAGNTATDSINVTYTAVATKGRVGLPGHQVIGLLLP